LNIPSQNIRYQIREQIDFAAILYNKGLYKQSLKILDKTKIIRKRRKNMAFEIVEFEKLIESQYIRKYPRACRRISNSGQGTKLSKYHFQ
jgi:hypothetical protein